MANPEWLDVGDATDLAPRDLQQVPLKRPRIALTCRNGSFSAISGICNHVGGPLGEGWLDGDYVTCPWHFWKFHHRDGRGEPGFEADAVPAYAVKVENGRVLIDATNGDRSWTTIGVSGNIIEASWRALEESLVYGLLHHNG